MKKLVVAITCFLFAQGAMAQKELLSLNENNKYIYYQVVEQPGLTADAMYSRELNFLRTAYPKLSIKPDKANKNISGTGKFVVTSVVLLKHEDGELSFTYSIENKEGKYRYWITAFVFTPYQRDRYGNSVPQPGIAIPLEDSSKFNKKDREGYLDQTALFCKQLEEKLKLYIINAPAPKKEEISKKIVTDKW